MNSLLFTYVHNTMRHSLISLMTYFFTPLPATLGISSWQYQNLNVPWNSSIFTPPLKAKRGTSRFLGASRSIGMEHNMENISFRGSNQYFELYPEICWQHQCNTYNPYVNNSCSFHPQEAGASFCPGEQSFGWLHPPNSPPKGRRNYWKIVLTTLTAGFKKSLRGPKESGYSHYLSLSYGHH